MMLVLIDGIPTKNTVKICVNLNKKDKNYVLKYKLFGRYVSFRITFCSFKVITLISHQLKIHF